MIPNNRRTLAEVLGVLMVVGAAGFIFGIAYALALAGGYLILSANQK